MGISDITDALQVKKDLDSITLESVLKDPSDTAVKISNAIGEADNALVAKGTKSKVADVVHSIEEGAHQLTAHIPGGKTIDPIIDTVAEATISGVNNIAKFMKDSGIDEQVAAIAKIFNTSLKSAMKDDKNEQPQQGVDVATHIENLGKATAETARSVLNKTSIQI